MADLGITENVEQTIDELAAAAAQAFLADNEPFEVTPELIASAIRTLEAYTAVHR